MERLHSVVARQHLNATASLHLHPAKGLGVQGRVHDFWRIRIRDAMEAMWIASVTLGCQYTWEDIYEALHSQQGFSEEIVSCIIACHPFVARNAGLLSRIVKANVEYGGAAYEMVRAAPLFPSLLHSIPISFLPSKSSHTAPVGSNR